ncbi:MAG: zinc-ribbon domain-containing protein [Armatimonadia bacterium]
MDTKRCPGCHKLDADQAVRPSWRDSALANCPKCRTPILPEMAFCTSCGVKVQEMTSVDRKA